MTWNFSQQLADWGPDSEFDPVSLLAAREYCQKVTIEHYENFAVVSRLLPKELHPHFQSVYAFCRWSDDLGDEVEGAQKSLDLLAWWKEELEKCNLGQPRHPVFVTLKETIDEFDIPLEPFENLISAFEQDQVKTEYQNLEELTDYCRRSADPVGRIVLHLFVEATPENFELSDRICTGLQLANFWQDIARDYEIARVYLPREDREKSGYTDEMLEQKTSTPEFLALLKYEVNIARQFLLSGRPLVDRLPAKYQVDIDLFVRGGICILDRIEQVDFKTWETRPKVTKFDGVKLFCSAVMRKWGRRIGLSSRFAEVEPPNVEAEVTT
ncbi:squalene synthase HpnC [Planctomycetaceae bacterium]|nr:squalene synthase HpnC [Planctomycetaceae bacterium]MDG2388482.1 squalene synthase HpnC [Planctomycetaceae bacterium]